MCKKGSTEWKGLRAKERFNYYVPSRATDNYFTEIYFNVDNINQKIKRYHYNRIYDAEIDQSNLLSAYAPLHEIPN